MHSIHEVVQGRYFQDLMVQPQALRETLAGLNSSESLERIATRLKKRQFQHVVLTGMGSSYYALHPLHLKLIENGITSLMVESSELLHYMKPLLGSDALLLLVSQSGESAEIIRLLEKIPDTSLVIGVTNTPGSTLFKKADAVVLTHAGEESTVSCKTYVTTLMALIWLGAILGEDDPSALRKDLEQSVPAARSYLEQWNDHVRQLQKLLVGVRNLFLLGRGGSLAAVGSGGLTIKESTHYPAEGMTCAAFRHGPLEMTSKEIFALIFAGDPRTADLNRKLRQDIEGASGRTGWVGGDSELESFRLPAGPACALPILEILPVQMITLALAAMKGREAGIFERLDKVTATE